MFLHQWCPFHKIYFTADEKKSTTNVTVFIYNYIIRFQIMVNYNLIHLQIERVEYLYLTCMWKYTYNKLHTHTNCPVLIFRGKKVML